MNTLLAIIFIVGYVAIAFEHGLKMNKAASALLTGVLCWVILVLNSGDAHTVTEHLETDMSEIAGILFFLLGAMTIVELIDSHDGFDLITSRITATNKRTLLVVISLITFFLSALLDNLTTSIVVVSLLRKMIDDKRERLLFAGMVVIAANAGGAWSPIGDVTTTMLWIGGQLSPANLIVKLILPSLACLFVPLLILRFRLKGDVRRPIQKESERAQWLTGSQKAIVLISGLMVLVLVPVFKMVTHLPPYMGMLFGLGILWLITGSLHKKKEPEFKGQLSVEYALQRIDTPSILFFMGILLSIGALKASGLLSEMATSVSAAIASENLIVMAFGLISSVVDNVPLVAAAQGMYSLEVYPMDHTFWEFLAYSTGTGGSALIIGSAAGVAAMGIEKIDFFWYLKQISWLALAGFFSGAGVYILQSSLFN